MSLHKKFFWLSASMFVILVLLVGAISSQFVLRADSHEIPPVKAAKDQEDALHLARKIDLPLLEKADKVVIEESVGGRRHTIQKADDIKELREALKVSEQQPSGGKNAVTILFYRKDDLIRKVWVFKSGEWGFERPSISWTTGHQRDLWEVDQKHLK